METPTTTPTTALPASEKVKGLILRQNSVQFQPAVSACSFSPQLQPTTPARNSSPQLQPAAPAPTPPTTPARYSRQLLLPATLAHCSRLLLPFAATACSSCPQVLPATNARNSCLQFPPATPACKSCPLIPPATPASYLARYSHAATVIKKFRPFCQADQFFVSSECGKLLTQQTFYFPCQALANRVNEKQFPARQEIGRG